MMDVSNQSACQRHFDERFDLLNKPIYFKCNHRIRTDDGKQKFHSYFVKKKIPFLNGATITHSDTNPGQHL